MVSRPRLFALVPCAGMGVRAGVHGPKQYAIVGGKPMVSHTLEALAQVPRLTATLVALAGDDRQFAQAVPGFENERGWVVRCGGPTRAQTVANGLQALVVHGAQPHDWVLVHDAARCLLLPAWVDRLIDACLEDPVGGLLALPMADTLKRESDERVQATVDRRRIWAAQTPQMFRIGELLEALARAGEAVTDEASAIESIGHTPRLVQGDAANFKLTWPADFALAEDVLRARRGPADEIKAFVPARDFQLSLRFYVDLGFEADWQTDDLASLRRQGSAFLLQRFYEPAHADNFVMHLLVSDLDAWWRLIHDQTLVARYGIHLEAPGHRPWGLRDLAFTDPSGVLWRVAQRPVAEGA